MQRGEETCPNLAAMSTYYCQGVLVPSVTPLVSPDLRVEIEWDGDAWVQGSTF